MQKRKERFLEMEDGKDESGFALLYALGAIILISVVVGGIFLLARTVFFQDQKVDQFKRVRQVEEYALQEGTKKIQKKIDTHISSLETIDFGTDITQISSDIDKLFQGYSVSEADIGSDQQFSYEITIDKIDKKKVNPYILTDSDGNFGWKEDSSVTNESKATNAQFTFAIKVAVTEKGANGKLIKETAKSDYVYQVQWNDIDVEDSVTELDVWRNIVYSYYLPNSAGYLSADSWMRKMDDVYRYSDHPTTFGYAKFDNHLAQVFGNSDNATVDITDGSFLDFSSSGKMLYSTLTFEGSLLLEHGIRFEGNNLASQLVVNNILSMRPANTKANAIQNLNVVAGNGTFVDLNGGNNYLAVNEKDASFQTSGLLINNATSTTNLNAEGFLFGSGNLFVQTQAPASDFQFSNYLSNSLTHTPQDEFWNEFIKGSMIVASSNFYAGELSLGSDIQSTEKDQRKIDLGGNFLLTNAMLDSEKGQENFSYFKEEGLYSQPHAPAVFTLSGENTDMTVKGMSFIDAPKTERRKSINETGSETVKYYGDKEEWNTLDLKGGASMNLSYTGIEPFNLKLEKDSLLSLNLLPNLIYFDPTFLVNSISEGQLNGKIILRAFNQADADKVKSELEKYRIPVSIRLAEGDSKNGEVTIIKPNNPAGADTSQIISRTFSYVENVTYK